MTLRDRAKIAMRQAKNVAGKEIPRRWRRTLLCIIGPIALVIAFAETLGREIGAAFGYAKLSVRENWAQIKEMWNADADRPAQAVGQELPGESALTPIQDEKYYALAEGLRTAATDRDALNAAWAKMQPDRDELLRAGRGDLVSEVDRYYDQLLRPLPIPPDHQRPQEWSRP